ncbi:MAG: Hint domain-containing protein [Silicimonas sp.]
MTIAKKITDGTVVKAGTRGLCAGANVRTPCGARRIEFVRKGDLIVTRDNGLRPVRMIWTRTVTAAEMAADPSLAPVVLKPRAIGPMMPQKELAVGRAHRLLIPGWRLEDEDDATNCLVPARDVAGINDNAFVERREADVTYYNIVFDEPQVFCANGLPIESFSPDDETIAETPEPVLKELQETFPDLAPRFADYPAPRYKKRERVSYTPDFA